MNTNVLRGAVCALAVGALCAPASALAAGANHGLDLRVTHGTSQNWSGYDLIGPGPYESVSASWTQPAVNCAKTRNGYAAFWTGIDGATSETVEQTGTEGDCAAGKATYGAWYEMYPKGSVRIAEPVLPGDQVSASVTYLGKALFGLISQFSLVLSDSTQGWTHTVDAWIRTPKLASAEAIAEAPSSDILGELPLSDFGTSSFSSFSANGSTVTALTPGLEPVTMITSLGVVKAEPSALHLGSFSDTWLHS
jgi:peptidase A4-like protein